MLHKVVGKRRERSKRMRDAQRVGGAEVIAIGSLFDGIAGFPLAGSRLGITAKWASEIEPFRN